MEGKKILVFNKNFNTSPFTYNDTLFLAKNNSVTVLCENQLIDTRYDASGIEHYSVSNNSIRVKINRFLTIHDIRLSYKNKALKNRFHEVVESVNPDLIQCHFGDEALILLDNLDLKKLKIPIVIMFHGYDASAWIRNKTYCKKYKQLLKLANIKIICCSENMKSRLINKGFPKEKIDVLYYGVDLDFYKIGERPKNNIKLFTQIAVFRNKKGFEQTIKAFYAYSKKYKNRNFKVILGGDGVLKQEMMKLVAQLNMKELFSFPGWLTQEQVKNLLTQSDYFVYHSITNNDGDMEGIPNSIIEAMAMNLPVISTYHSGIPELVQNRENGLLVDEKDIDAYADVINEIQSLDISRNREKVYNKFNLKKRNLFLNQLFEKYIKAHNS